MIYDISLSRPLPHPVEVPCDYGRLTRMLATRVVVHVDNQWRQSPIYVSLRGPGLRKDGSRAKQSPHAYVDGTLNPKKHVTREMLGDDNWKVVVETRAAVEIAMQMIITAAGGDES